MPAPDRALIRHCVIFGASGDLASRYLLPALAELWEARKLPPDLQILGVAREEWNTATFVRHVASRTAALPDARGPLKNDFLRMLRYEPADITNQAQVQRVLADAGQPLLAYLAIPPALFMPAIDALAAAADAVSHVVVEKPFGTDLASARALNARLHSVFPERAVFRMDYFLGIRVFRNIIGLRLANQVFEPLWNSRYIERVEIIWDETLTAAGRSAFYDHTGALRDVVQNHLLQLLALVAMEPPHSLEEHEFRNCKATLLAAVSTLTDEQVVRQTVRGRYGPGRIGGVPVPGYLEEAGVRAERGTETFAEATLTIDNARWSGVPFLLRTGKALALDRRRITVYFKRAPYMAFSHDQAVPPNVLELQMLPDRVALHVNVNGTGDHVSLETIALQHTLGEQELSAYARLMLDVLRGDATFSVRDDEIEESWRIVAPILRVWADGTVPLVEYPAGSHGPSGTPAHP